MTKANTFCPAQTINQLLLQIHTMEKFWFNIKPPTEPTFLAQNLCHIQVSIVKSTNLAHTDMIILFCFFFHRIDDRSIVSCSGDGIVLYTQLTSQPFTDPNASNLGAANLNYFNCHSTGTTYEVLTIPTESNSFMSCGEDGTVRLFDLRKISR